MADIILPADLPENLEWDQIIAPNGSDIGMPAQYGYNYLLQQVNNAQKVINDQAALIEELREELSNKTNIVQTYNAAEVTPLPNQHIQEMTEAADLVGDLTAERLELERRVGALEGMSQSGTWTPELMDIEGNEAESYQTRRGRWVISGDLIRLDYLIELSGKGSLSKQLRIPVPTELNASVNPYLSDRGSLRMTRTTVPAGFAYAESVFLNNSVIRLDYYYVDASNVLNLGVFTGEDIPDHLQCYGNVTLKRS